MRAKTYFLLRFAIFLAMAIVAPVWAFGSPNGMRGIALLVFEIIMVGLASYYFWRYRRVSEEAKMQYGPPAATVQRMAASKSRKYALIFIGLALGVIGAEYWEWTTQHRLHFVAVLLAPVLLLLGLGGLVNPEVVFGARPDVPASDSVRLASRTLLLAGFAIGSYACYYFFFLSK